MRKIWIGIGLVIIAGMYVSCEKSKLEHMYAGPWFLAFESGKMTAPESITDPVEVAVQMVSPLKNDPLNVEFTIGGEGLVAGKDYKLLNESQTLTFAPGNLTEYIRIQLFDNLDINGDRDLVLALTSTNADIQIGQPGLGSKRDSCILTVKDDDCPLTMELFNGKVSGKETTSWWNNVKFPATFTPIEEIVPNKIKYHVSGIFFAVQLQYAYNAWMGSSDIAEYNEVEVILDYTNPSAPTISWEKQLGVTVYWKGDKSAPDEYWIQTAQNQRLNISTCDRTLDFTYRMANPDWARTYDFRVTFNFNE